MIDCIRQDTAHPELPLLDQEDEESRSLIDVVSRHTYDLQSEQEARREEILLLTQELREWSLSFQDLSAATPAPCFHAKSVQRGGAHAVAG